MTAGTWTRALLAAALLAGALRTASAGVEAFVTSGDRVTGDVAAGGDVETLRIAWPEGETLSVNVRSAVGVQVKVLDPSGAVATEGRGRIVRLSAASLVAGEAAVEIRSLRSGRAATYVATLTCGPVPSGGARRIDARSTSIGAGATEIEALAIGSFGGVLAPSRFATVAGGAAEFTPGLLAKRKVCLIGVGRTLVPQTTDMTACGPSLLLAPMTLRLPASLPVTVTLPYRVAEVTRPVQVLVSGIAGRLEPVPGVTVDSAAGVVRFTATRLGTYQAFQGNPSVGPVLKNTLTAHDAAASDRLGPVAVTGVRLVVGAPGRVETVASAPVATGAAYVFDKAGSGWQQVAKLLPSDLAPGGRFGHAVAMDGDTIAVGAPQATTTATSFTTTGLAGAVYVFQRLNGVWTEIALLAPPASGTPRVFGGSVALRRGRLVVGAPGSGTAITGAVYVYDRGPNGWSLTQTLVAPSPRSNSLFGWTVAHDGTTILVGAPYENAAYPFVRTGGSWTSPVRLAPSAPSGFETFGVAVDVQGARAMVGAPSRTQQGGSAGAAYVFEITAGAWTEAARIDAPQNGSSELFGISVSLDGERALLGAPTSSLVTQIGGAAYLVRRGSGSWASPTAIVRTTIAPADGYGRFVLLRGAKAFVGSPDADFAATDAGAVHVINVTGR